MKWDAWKYPTPSAFVHKEYQNNYTRKTIQGTSRLIICFEAQKKDSTKRIPDLMDPLMFCKMLQQSPSRHPSDKSRLRFLYVQKVSQQLRLTKWLLLPLKESKNDLSTKSRGLTQHMAYKNCLEKPFILYGPQVIMSCREKLERVWWVCVSCVRRHTQKGGNGRVHQITPTCLEFLTIWKLFRVLERIFNNLRMQHITIHIALN